MLRSPLEVQLVEDVAAVETRAGNLGHAVVVLVERVATADVQPQRLACSTK